MKADLLADKTPEEIALIWNEHFATKVGQSLLLLFVMFFFIRMLWQLLFLWIRTR